MMNCGPVFNPIIVMVLVGLPRDGNDTQLLHHTQVVSGCPMLEMLCCAQNEDSEASRHPCDRPFAAAQGDTNVPIRSPFRLGK